MFGGNLTHQMEHGLNLLDLKCPCRKKAAGSIWRVDAKLGRLLDKPVNHMIRFFFSACEVSSQQLDASRGASLVIHDALVVGKMRGRV